ncbi:DNA alkylation repair protein [Muricauda sp. DJ-13]|uniref:DNA alkylation repair protein n=1 Tax=Croceivirga thetidis TaxID=2721623 RepID=A0ABX1GU25_9FLAO|nr:DNA alkylation repair protein [Croceivirga thetidis]
MKNRKGARSLKDINPEVLDYLNQGKIETANLMEWLAIDQQALLKVVLEETEKVNWLPSFEEAINSQKKPTANSNTKVIGETFAQLTSDDGFYQYLKSHTSDVVRCWACWAESLLQDEIGTLLNISKFYAADKHFGVREVVIFASKDRMNEQLEECVTELSKWTTSKDENIRRFVAEAMRPVGVWVKKIEAFQENPAKGLPLLEPLKSDPSKYVRDSVGNWLNDASKSKPEWVIEVCSRWQKESQTKETAYIIKKALRTIQKTEKP